ncbi:MAG TPA: MurT ligase domain-containing protein [Candidatus Dormibacteraeota bacterium]|nr:MurT ligase domain-containing protein [Candidatus Dormibacteraeota bacterium]
MTSRTVDKPTNAAAPGWGTAGPPPPFQPPTKHRVPPLTPRRFAALMAGKAAAVASRVSGRGGGTSVPGMVARRVDPTILASLVADQHIPVIAITGSNGKTTTARFSAALLRAAGFPVSHNKAGSNLVQGVTSVAVGAADLRGRTPPRVMVMEIDEGALPLVAAELRPSALLVTDLFRDQLDRYGEIYAVADTFEAVARELAPDSALCLNADDPIVAGLAPTRSGRRVMFGLELDHDTDRITRAADTIRCPRCRANLVYDHVYLSHMGAWHCPACGLERPPLDVAVTELEVRGLDETRFHLRTPAGELDLVVPQSGVHIAYDAAAAVAISLGLGVPLDHAAEALATVRPAFGRLERIAAGRHSIVLGFAKNPTSFNTTLRALATEGLPRQLLVAASNTLVDGEDFAWLWDVDFESAAGGVERVTVSGLRADELANRLKYAGVDPAVMTIVEDRPAALDAALAGLEPGGTLTILAGYTPTIELREEMRRRGWVGPYWEV